MHTQRMQATDDTAEVEADDRRHSRPHGRRHSTAKAEDRRQKTEGRTRRRSSRQSGDSLSPSPSACGRCRTARPPQSQSQQLSAPGQPCPPGPSAAWHACPPAEHDSLFECFSCICPEPVLTKRSFFNVQWHRKRLCVFLRWAASGTPDRTQSGSPSRRPSAAGRALRRGSASRP